MIVPQPLPGRYTTELYNGLNVSKPSFRSSEIDAYAPYLEQLAFSAFIIKAFSDPMAAVVPLLVVAPDST